MLLLTSSLITGLVLTLITYTSSFKDGRPTCDRKIVNTYLHLATLVVYVASLTLLFAPLATKTMAKQPMVFFGITIAAAIAEFIALLVAYKANPRNLALKYGALAVFATMAGFLMSLFVLFVPADILVKALAATAVIMLLMTGVAYKYDHLLDRIDRTKIMWVLIGLMVASVAMAFFVPVTSYAWDVLLGIGCLVFILLVALKTKDIKDMPCSEETPPDYVRYSMSIFISLRGVFENIAALLTRGRARRGGRARLLT